MFFNRLPFIARRRLLWIAPLALATLFLIWFANGSTAQTSHHGGKGGSVGPTPVSVATAQKGDIAITRQGLGTVTPLANIVVRTQISGQLTQIAFKEGQIVQKGDFLAEIDPRPYELSLQNARGSLVRDQSLLKEAQLNLLRYQKLLTQDSIAKQQVDTQQSLVEQYQGAVITDHSQIDTAKLNLLYCHITAPISGRVGLRQVDQGNYVQVGDANGIVTLTQLQPITALFTLPEDDLPAIMKRLGDGAELTTTALDRNQSAKLAEGKLVSVDNQIDTTTGTIKLRAQFDNIDNALFPNQFVNIILLVDTLHDTTLVPTAAIQRGAPGTFVYLLNDKKVSLRVVKLGPSQGDTIAVTDGLAPGDQVVTDGADKLRDGAEVTLPGDKDDTEKHHKGDKNKTSAPDDKQKEGTQP